MSSAPPLGTPSSPSSLPRRSLDEDVSSSGRPSSPEEGEIVSDDTASSTPSAVGPTDSEWWDPSMPYYVAPSIVGNVVMEGRQVGNRRRDTFKMLRMNRNPEYDEESADSSSGEDARVGETSERLQIARDRITELARTATSENIREEAKAALRLLDTTNAEVLAAATLEGSKANVNRLVALGRKDGIHTSSYWPAAPPVILYHCGSMQGHHEHNFNPSISWPPRENSLARRPQGRPHVTQQKSRLSKTETRFPWDPMLSRYCSSLPLAAHSQSPLASLDDHYDTDRRSAKKDRDRGRNRDSADDCNRRRRDRNQSVSDRGVDRDSSQGDIRGSGGVTQEYNIADRRVDYGKERRDYRRRYRENERRQDDRGRDSRDGGASDRDQVRDGDKNRDPDHRNDPHDRCSATRDRRDGGRNCDRNRHVGFLSSPTFPDQDMAAPSADAGTEVISVGDNKQVTMGIAGFGSTKAKKITGTDHVNRKPQGKKR
ncbi:hypothetical protein M427DRAFT_50072 [Gonapodya prolifera JEL478]|uniref:Uncharacterized protein n=1 Tax=Gonapodya prolifera (strain JEL478) TaxID=1344416 RepID=A0A138ZX04_GONPJ|nr:hypothetical protein M427DRAFT_50072 [Gonapodya prolifera JEL478]|eukprot:KXS09042.1 hypothetical protein M427DRAFT_50072 [Gonapodya prolifera JEL478]